MIGATRGDIIKVIRGETPEALREKLKKIMDHPALQTEIVQILQVGDTEEREAWIKTEVNVIEKEESQDG